MDEEFIIDNVFRRTIIPFEDEDEFIFTVISGYIDNMFSHELHIPKKLLTRALVCFRKEHPQEFDILMKSEKEDA